MDENHIPYKLNEIEISMGLYQCWAKVKNSDQNPIEPHLNRRKFRKLSTEFNANMKVNKNLILNQPTGPWDLRLDVQHWFVLDTNFLFSNMLYQLFAEAPHSPEFLQINRLGQVPAIRHGGFAMGERWAMEH